MPFIPHTPEDISAMLADIQIEQIQQLFDEIPKNLPKAQLDKIPAGLNEMEITRLMQARAPQQQPGGCFIGAGAYEHHSPAAVWSLVTRGEFYTAYTPYQAEASQGTLQVIYEYQTMMAHITGMQVSNASMYDGATALAEAVLMAVRIKRHKVKRVLVPKTVHPHYRQVLQTILQHHDIVLEELNYSNQTGTIDLVALKKINTEGLAALIIPQPNFFGVLEEVDALTNFAHEQNALAIALVNPMAMALLKEPGSWGNAGADIVCGEGQPLGVPLSGGGPYFGFMCTKEAFVRQLPGRIVGRTEDASGRIGYTLTLQAREQHIRRAKATSNICTNQGLMVTAATIYMSLMGAQGLREVAMASHTNAQQLKSLLLNIKNVESVFDTPFFHEFVIRVPGPKGSAKNKLTMLAEQGIQGGYDLQSTYPELENCILICVTETKTKQDLERYVKVFDQ